MKLDIVQKAFYVWHDGMIGYGPEIYNEVTEVPTVLARSANQAKSIASEPMSWEINGEDPKYTDLKVRRAKGYDIVIFEGAQTTRWRVESKLKHRERSNKLKSFLNDPILTHCYIMKRGTYYRPNCSGYTSRKDRAGIYTIKEGVEDAIRCNGLWLERTSIKDHNAMIEKSIAATRELILN